MTTSPYNYLIKSDDAFIVYNSMSNALLTVDEDIFNRLSSANPESVAKDDFDSDDWELLKSKRIIVENSHDEWLRYKAAIMPMRNMQNVISLTIATTLDCNYSCFYCFETKKKLYITDEVIDNILALIKRQPALQQLQVTWFGGEPLMAYDKIERFNALLELPQSATYSTNIITNGYYLTEDVILSLKKNKIDSIQLTLDGLKDTHNKRKRCATTKDTFTAVFNNIDTFVKHEKDILLTIRVNLDENNKHEFIELSDFIYRRYPEAKNIRVVPAFITDIDSGDCKTCNLDRDAMARFIQSLSSQTGDTSQLYPTNMFSECTIRNPNILVVAPNGKLTKCLETVGDPSYEFGELTKDGIRLTNEAVLNRYLYGADPMEDEECKACSLLPICFGGCPHKRLENKYNNATFNVCSSFKGNLSSYLT